MGTSMSSQKEKENKETQVKTYTQITIKDLNNITNNVKTKEEHTKKLEEDANIKLLKEYLYSLDLGKLLIDAATKKQNKLTIVTNDYYIHKFKNNTYETSIINKKEGVSVFCFTITTFEQLLDEYKIFVKDVLKIDAEIRFVNNTHLTNTTSYYEAIW
jgi:hypothetical protein